MVSVERAPLVVADAGAHRGLSGGGGDVLAFLVDYGGDVAPACVHHVRGEGLLGFGGAHVGGSDAGGGEEEGEEG